MNEVLPRFVLEQVASAVPAECHDTIIIIGSVAAGYQLLSHDASLQVRTKDIDCVLSPRIKAVESGVAVAERLLASGWRPKTEGEHGEPGTATTPDDKLPAVRLYPPNSNDWFIELLTLPESETDYGKRWMRLELTTGHYGLPSFEFLPVSTFHPVKTDLGIHCARPEMMALANLLEHPEIKPDLIRGSSYKGHEIKRSNKDLGRVLAIARLSSEKSIESWPEGWEEALRECFPKRWRALAGTAGAGLRKLLASEEDLEEAHDNCNNGLLASRLVTIEQLRLGGRRLIQDAIEPLEERAKQ